MIFFSALTEKNTSRGREHLRIFECEAQRKSLVICDHSCEVQEESDSHPHLEVSFLLLYNYNVLKYKIFYFPILTTLFNVVFLGFDFLSRLFFVFCGAELHRSELGPFYATSCSLNLFNSIYDFVNDVYFAMAWGAGIIWLIIFVLSILISASGWKKHKEELSSEYGKLRRVGGVVLLLLPIIYYSLVPLLFSGTYKDDREGAQSVSSRNEHCIIDHKKTEELRQNNNIHDGGCFVLCDNVGFVDSCDPAKW